MNIIHRNIGTFEDNRIIYVLSDSLCFYVKALCSPDTDYNPKQVTGMNSEVNCKECLEMMADFAINTHNPETKF